MRGVGDALFTDFARDARPLDRLLDDWARPARSNVEMLKKDDFDAATDEQLLERVLVDWDRQTKLALARVGKPRFPDRPARSERRDSEGNRLAMWRWTVSFPLQGNLEVVERWPNGFDRAPCESDLYDQPVPAMVWRLSGDGPVLYVDVPALEDPQGVDLPRDRILAAVDYLDAAIDAANRQIYEYDQELRAKLLDLFARQRQYLGAVSRQTQELAEMLHIADLALELADDQVAEAPTTQAPDGHLIKLDVLVHERTFDDLVSVTRKWGAGVERYPKAFFTLEEEILSSLLVPSLNIAFDLAHREVFSVEGKTDIFVESARGNRENAAYFGEAKIWSGMGSVPEDVTQLFRYSNGRTSQVMLLYYVKRKQLHLIQERCQVAIERLSGFGEWHSDREDAIAVIQHPEYGQPIAITLVFVHVPPVGDEEPDEDDLAA
jgi:hypothetical protein